MKVISYISVPVPCIIFNRSVHDDVARTQVGIVMLVEYKISFRLTVTDLPDNVAA